MFSIYIRMLEQLKLEELIAGVRITKKFYGVLP